MIGGVWVGDGVRVAIQWAAIQSARVVVAVRPKRARIFEIEEFAESGIAAARITPGWAGRI